MHRVAVPITLLFLLSPKGTVFMKPRITVITIGVDDLERSLRFYRDGLGFPTEGIIGKEFEYGAVVFIDLQPGLRLALWPRKSIAHDTGLRVSPTSSTEMTLGHNVSSKAEVDSVMAKATSAGAAIIKPAHDTFWGGYSGYFQDPDGHLWEVVWNPQWSE
jgi:catechol 2,3-dioxygenase-like lactoylglutathione lyase family enzyme